MSREGIGLARCTIERLMKRLGLQGARRGKVVRTTVPDSLAPCPLDRVNRQFKADRPNHLWVETLRRPIGAIAARSIIALTARKHL
jgi:putative transposase